MQILTQRQHHEGETHQARLVATRSRAERGDRHLRDRVVDRLDGRGWVRRRDLLAELNQDNDGGKVTDDELRAVARYSNGEIIGSSRGGYCLTRQAAVEDVGHVIGEWLSRSKQMRARVAEVLQVLHGRSRASQEVTSDRVGRTSIQHGLPAMSADITRNKSGIDALGGAA